MAPKHMLSHHITQEHAKGSYSLSKWYSGPQNNECWCYHQVKW